MRSRPVGYHRPCSRPGPSTPHAASVIRRAAVLIPSPRQRAHITTSERTHESRLGRQSSHRTPLARPSGTRTPARHVACNRSVHVDVDVDDTPQTTHPRRPTRSKSKDALTGDAYCTGRYLYSSSSGGTGLARPALPPAGMRLHGGSESMGGGSYSQYGPSGRCSRYASAYSFSTLACRRPK